MLLQTDPGVAQLVARLTGGQEAVSSSLATRTMKESNAFALDSFIIQSERRTHGLNKIRGPRKADYAFWGKVEPPKRVQ